MNSIVIVNETRGGVMVFETRERAESYLEPIDVKNEEYQIYDSTGLLLETHIGRDSRGIEWVSIQEPRQPENRESELIDLLCHFLKVADSKIENLRNQSLAELVRASLKFKTD